MSNTFKTKKTKGNIILKILKWTFIVLAMGVLAVCIYAGSILYGLKRSADAIVEERGSGVFRENLTSIVYDSEGQQISRLCGDKDSYYLEFQDIPFMVKEIFIMTEDKSFYEHSGVDYKAIVRAFFENAINGEITQGGSTITQQLSKLIYLDYKDITYTRKIKEMFIARRLEKLYTKDQILEFYINDIYYGNGLYGIQAASRGYFNKDVSELSLAELCFICSIPNNPEYYNPYTNFENTISRRNRILRQLNQEKIITNEEYDEACAADIKLSSGKEQKNNYVDTYIKYCATRELMKIRGFEFRYKFASDEDRREYQSLYNEMYGECNSLLFTGGYKIYTSIDMEKQEKLQNTLDEQFAVNNELSDEGIYKFQGSATCIDNFNGMVVAIVGGRSQETEGYTLNRAYQSFRQPGSSIKPLVVYAPLFERNYTPESIVTDRQIKDGPHNYDEIYLGDMTARDALAYSRNTVAWEMFDKMGAEKCINYLTEMQFANIVKRDYSPTTAIGGMTYGVTACEMAAAFETLENDGVYRYATCITKIVDSYGVDIVDNTIRLGTQVYETEAARMTTDALTSVLTYGTGTAFNVENAICAAKTGTTNDTKDAWLVGYSKYYTTAVWAGFDLPEMMSGEERMAAGFTWKSFMTEIHKGLEKKEFTKYKSGNISIEKQNSEEDTEETDTEDEDADGIDATEASEDTEETETAEETKNAENVETKEAATKNNNAVEDGMYYDGETTYVPEDEGLYVE